MTDWQPIETAPTGVIVRLGWWEERYSPDRPPLVWRTSVGIAWEKTLFGRKRAFRSHDLGKATHWKPLPEPPSGEKA